MGYDRKCKLKSVRYQIPSNKLNSKHSYDFKWTLMINK